MDLLWRAALWEANVGRNRAVWVEEVYRDDPRWEWNCSCGEGGRTSSMRKAQQLAHRHAVQDHGKRRPSPSRGGAE